MQLFNATNKIIEIFNSNPLVNTITMNDNTSIDLNKKNIYPLVNITLIDSYPNLVGQTFNYDITILQQKDIVKDLNIDKYDNDNTIDNLNECNQIMMSFLSSVSTDYSIVISNNPNFEYLYDITVNGLDGIKTSISVEVHNQNTMC